MGTNKRFLGLDVRSWIQCVVVALLVTGVRVGVDWREGEAATYGKQSGSTTGGGGGTPIAAGTGISTSVDGGVTTIINAAPFGSPISLPQNNDAGTPVTTMTYTNTFTVKTPGAVTSGNVFGAKLDGGTINTDISFLNEQAPQLVTTSIAQPSIAWNPRTDVLDVTVGATTLTKLTITGFSMDADRLIAVEWVTANGGEAATITTQSFVRLNNETNGVVGDYTFQRAGTAASMAATAAWVFTDSSDTGASSLGMSRGEFSKSPGGLVRGTIWISILQGGVRFEEHTTGVGDSTTDVTSIVILPTSGNLAGTGDHYKFYRGRAFAH